MYWSFPKTVILPTTVSVALLSLSGCTQMSSTVTPTTSSVPILGNYPLGGASGYGLARPATIYNGGDPSGRVTSIRWDSWGGPTATGHGTAYYIPPTATAAIGTFRPATVVAFNRGECHGQITYLALEWYFPTMGESFVPSGHQELCK